MAIPETAPNLDRQELHSVLSKIHRASMLPRRIIRAVAPPADLPIEVEKSIDFIEPLNTFPRLSRAQLTFREAAVGHEALYFQAAEVGRCIDAGRRESSVRPLAESIATLEVLDEIRRQIGVVFDEES